MDSLSFRPLLAALLLSLLTACAARAPYTGVMASQRELPERTLKRVIEVWQQELARHIARDGGGDPAVLSQTRALRSRDALRPARVTFAVLDVEAYVPDRDGWDIQGVLVGKYMNGSRNWYVFIVGVVARKGYRPAAIEDIRIVTLSAQGPSLQWQMSSAEPSSVQRYRDSFAASAAARFPGEADQFNLNIFSDRVVVWETRSGADWSLQRGSGT